MQRLAVLARRLGVIAAFSLFVIPAGFILDGSADHAYADEPEITFQWPPEDGLIFNEPLEVIQICFREPIDVRDKPPIGEGEFTFDMDRPDGLGVGMRIVFQANGYGVAVYPGIVDQNIEGQWGISFEVRDAESLEHLTGGITWQVREATGQPIITPTPAVCPTTGDPPTTPIDDPDETDAPTVTPEGNGDNGLDEDSDVDILELALLTVGASGGAAVIVLIGFLIRRRVGFWLHRPPENGDDSHDDDDH